MPNLYLETEDYFVKSNASEQEGMCAWDAEALDHEQMTGCAGGEKQKQGCREDWPWKGISKGTESGACPCGQS